VHVLLNADATTRQIKAAFNWLARSASPDEPGGRAIFGDDDARNGDFTFYLMQALKKSKGQDSIEKVYAYVRDEFLRMCLRNSECSRIPCSARVNTERVNR
jgi:hypothetical protein